MTSLVLLGLGTAIHYFAGAPKDKTPANSNESKNSTENQKFETYLFMIKGAKKILNFSKKAICLSKNLSDWIRSPKYVETIVLLLGTIGMAYSKFTPFKRTSSLFSKVKIISGSLLTESRNILTMHQLMKRLSDLAKNRKPPIKELSIATAMIVASHLANRYSK